MKKSLAITGYLLLALFLVSGSGTSSAQSINDIKVPDPGKPVCAYCGTSDFSKHAKDCPYYVPPLNMTNSKGSKSFHSKPDYNAMIAGSIFQSMLSSMFSTGTNTDAAQQYEALMAQQAEAQAQAQQAMALQQQKEAAFKAQHNNMMQAYKESEGSSGTAYKSLTDAANNSSGAYKTLGDAERLASNAQMPFDTPSDKSAGINDVTTGMLPLFSAIPFQ
jgi:hypothetical protein